jgi:hypothetical protein
MAVILVHSFPLYWCMESNAPDPSFLTRSHMQETAPPYRMSKRAFRIRVSLNHWLHIGTYRYHVEKNYWGIGGVSANQIAKWGSANRDRDQGPDPAAANGSTATPAGRGDEPGQDG